MTDKPEIEIPETYVAASEGGGYSLIHQGMPITASGRSWEDCMQAAAERDLRARELWVNGRFQRVCSCGKWINFGLCCTQCYYEFHESKEDLLRGEREPDQCDREGENGEEREEEDEE
jgi:hypothetical protein